jgi:hypothetical protein
MFGWIFEGNSPEVQELFRIKDSLYGSNKDEISLCIKNECEKCNSKEFTESNETGYIVCIECGNIQNGTVELSVSKARQYGKTVYDPTERFRYWVELAQGNVKLPIPLYKEVEKFNTNTELREFLMRKENRKYRKFYGCIMKKWDPELLQPLSNTEIESLYVNFNHLLSNHARSRKKNEKTGRKKSLPHYIFLITLFLNKIGREDLACNFLPMRCSKVKRDYEKIINEIF